jgi:hypothetical protein
MRYFLLAIALTVSVGLALTLLSRTAGAGCPSYDPNCERPCPPGQIC